MDLVDYLRVFRRRWPVIAATVVVAVGAAWATTETIAPAAEPRPPTYQATTTLFPTGSTMNLEAVAVVATSEPVTQRAAEILDVSGTDLLVLRRSVQAAPNLDAGLLTITGYAREREVAVALADAFAEGLDAYLQQLHREAVADEVAGLRRQIRDANEAGDEVYAATLRAELALQRQVSGPGGQIQVIEEATPSRAVTDTFTPPDSPAIRLSIAGAIGLIAGLVLALLFERVDTKIRSSDQAADRFGRPVLAEIPTMKRSERRGIAAADHPTSPGADAFRLLGAGVHVAVRPRSVEGNHDPARTVLVTSSGPAEGKSTVVANLAAVLAEEGKRVIVLSADLRRPTLHQMLQTERSPGLTDVASNGEGGIRRYRQWTRLERVLFVPSGEPTQRPGEVLASPSVKALIEEATHAADWVLVDTAPILVAGESAPLFEGADLVLVVAKAESISSPVAERTRDTLHRVGADNAWVVLNHARESIVPGGYRHYQHAYRVVAEREARRERRLSRKGFLG